MPMHKLAHLMLLCVIFSSSATSMVFCSEIENPDIRHSNRIVNLCDKANSLVTDALVTRNYDNYFEAKVLLEESIELIQHLSAPESKALYHLSISLIYSRMVNQYFNTYFDSSQWTVKRDAGELSDMESWSSLVNSYNNAQEALSYVPTIVPDSHNYQGFIILLAALSFDVMRHKTMDFDGPNGRKILSMHARRLYHSANGYGCDFESLSNDVSSDILVNNSIIKDSDVLSVIQYILFDLDDTIPINLCSSVVFILTDKAGHTSYQ